MEDLQKTGISRPPRGLAVLALVGPSLVWCAEYIGSGEVILATRTGAILGPAVLWAIVVGIFLKFWIGMSGARYTVCTGEGMIDMCDRMPGPRHWAVWIVLVAQFATATLAIGSIATAAGAFLSNMIPARLAPDAFSGYFGAFCGWGVTFLAVGVVWSGTFNLLKIVMSVFVMIIVVGVVYVAAHVFPSTGELFEGLAFGVPEVPAWALAFENVHANPWQEILPLIGWGAGGFASQVWYTYWVLGAGYGACRGRPYGKPADVASLARMDRQTGESVKGWCHVLYADATLAMVIGMLVTGAFFIAGAAVLRSRQLAPEGPQVAITLAEVFASRWGATGGFLFMLAGTVALISTQIGQLAGWPRLLADSFRLCFPAVQRRIAWKWQFRFLLLFFLCANLVITLCFANRPVVLVKLSAICDGLLLTPLQALWVAVGLFFVLPRLLSAQAYAVLRPSKLFAVGLAVAFLVFAYFCIFQIPQALGF